LPAKDRYHDAVKHALIKLGWAIDQEQVRFKVGIRNLWIDIQASKSEQLVILVEVKGFENSPSSVEELSDAIGQYMVYTFALTSKRIPSQLYLAVPNAAYEGIWTEEIGQGLIESVGIKLLVFDPIAEEIIRWLPEPGM
jgi:hypothetical protein